MNDRILKWDEKYARGEHVPSWTPASPLPLAIDGVQPGLALDLACGAGRNAIFLAEQGWRVAAVDGSREGLRLLQAEARRRGVDHLIRADIADLESPSYRIDGKYDLICDTFFLHRPLFEQIRGALKPGGRFVAAIHLQPGNFRVAPGELRSLTESWGFMVLHASDEDGVSELIAQTAE